MEFTSHAFSEYCMFIQNWVEYLVAHVHTQNELAKSLIKCLKLITRQLLKKENILMTT